MTKFDPLLLQSAPFQNWAIVSFWFLNFSLRSHIQCIIKFCIKNLTTSHHPHGLHPNPAVPWCLAQVTLIVSFFFPWLFMPVFKRATEVPLYKHKSEHLSSRAYQSRAKFLQGLLHHTTPLWPYGILLSCCCSPSRLCLLAVLWAHQMSSYLRALAHASICLKASYTRYLYGWFYHCIQAFI